MLKRLFGLGKKETPPASPAPARRPSLAAPTSPFEDYFALHVRDLPLDQVAEAVQEHYLLHVEADTVGALLSEQGGWVTAYFPRQTVQGLGFNRQASFLARARGAWVIGYRIFAGEGMDVHYFHGDEHVAQLAFAQGEIEFEPEEPAPFAPLADLSGIVPRPPTQHPLDFHLALLAALGICDAGLGWEAALARHVAGTLGHSKVLTGG